MDISKPVGSEIVSVDFSVMTSSEIKSLSAKQITNPTVLDNLGHPVNGGLYDLALGAFLRNLCLTCGLDENSCPGHQGHIELPVPCYNPLFFNQLYIYLRSTCLYCHNFKLKKSESHRYACKLKLLQYGLIDECYEFDSISVGSLEHLSNENDDDDDEDMMVEGILPSNGSSKSKSNKSEITKQMFKELKLKRDEYVNLSIAKALSTGKTSEYGTFTATVNDERKKLIHDFYKKILIRPKCDNCGMYSPKYRKDGITKIFENSLNEKQLTNNRIKGLARRDMLKKQEQAKKLSGEKELNEEETNEELMDIPLAKPKIGSTYLLSTEVRNILKSVFKNEQLVLQYVFHARPNLSKKLVKSDMFFMDSIVVPPTRFRLPSKLGDEVHENSQNQLLSKVLTTSLLIRDLNDDLSKLQKDKVSIDDKKIIFNRLMNAFVTIQNDVNSFIDSTKAPTNNGKAPIPGIKQALEKKEGLFRKHMMGKRVNYAARSVISPDPNIETTEIGVPPVFATKLTYPEPVTNYNVAELRQAVMNGPDKWPGAIQIQNEDGSLISLIGMTLEQRKALANQLLTPTNINNLKVHTLNKKVYRHIKNNDIVIMNRQPTLHKASMMGHKVRVLPSEKTLRLHYANTGAYNADFDGDEMNLHFPQNENARAEAFNLANTDSQYLTPTSGSPVRGLIQDHISAGVWLTTKDSFFTKEKYQQYIYSCIRPEHGHCTGSKLIMLPPAIMKPQPLWTGKQIISTVMLNVTPSNIPGINLKSTNKIKNEYWGKGSTENEVIFHNGELVCGILDKSQYGASKYGIVHSMHEVYGPETAGKILSVLGRLFTHYISSSAFTCGMDDLRLTDEGNKWRKDILKKSTDIGREAAAEVTNLEEDVKATDPELLKRLEEILRDDNKLAILDAISSSKVNSITSEVVSTCVPDGTMKKFPENSMQSMALSGAKGSNVNVSQIMCLLGQQALEGRRVPVMVSGKTLPSFKPFETDARAGGYIKGRFYSGIRPQEYYFHCMAGREGLIDTAVKTSRSGYLQRCLTKQLEGVHVSYDNSVRDADGTLVQFLYGGDAVDITKESHMTQFNFCADNYDALLKKYNPAALIDHLDIESAIKYAKKSLKARKKVAKAPHYDQPIKYDPVLSKYNPAKYLGSVSESFQDRLEKFIDSNSDLFKKNKALLNDKKFRALMQLKYMRSLIDPGEAVGIIAAQSIGEPSTQMTLNTFHFAGHGAANVTLGIPRLREIVMTASASIQTPQMTLPVLDDVSDEQADAYCKSVAKIIMSEVIDNVEVVETVGSSENNNVPSRSYVVRLNFFDEKDYDEEYDIKKEQLQDVLNEKFLNQLESAIVKEIRKQKHKSSLPDELNIAVPKSQTALGAYAASKSGDGDEDGDEEDSRKKTKQAASYDDPDEDEIDTMRQAEKSDDEDLLDSNSDNESSDSDNDMDVDDEGETSKADKFAEVSKNMTQTQLDRQSAVVTSHKYVTKYQFDDEEGKWCEFKLELSADTEKLLMVNIIEDICKVCVIREIPNIGRCVFPKPEGGKRVLITEGVNFSAVWDHDAFIDVNGIRSNDVAAVLRTYGVEAARNTIVNEINRVFSTYAISVSFRHLELIADMMTRQGSYLAFNRQGMETSTSSLMKMSYETTCGFLTKAVLDHDREELTSPSAKLVVGKLSGVGTGSFEILTKGL